MREHLLIVKMTALQGMYAIQNKDIPRFRRFLDDMYYSHAPSKFPLYTAYCEVCPVALYSSQCCLSCCFTYE